MKKCLSVAVAVGLSGCVTSPADMPINPSDREFSQIYDVPNMSKGQIYEGSLKVSIHQDGVDGISSAGMG